LLRNSGQEWPPKPERKKADPQGDPQPEQDSSDQQELLDGRQPAKTVELSQAVHVDIQIRPLGWGDDSRNRALNKVIPGFIVTNALTSTFNLSSSSLTTHTGYPSSPALLPSQSGDRERVTFILFRALT
jgi:hypothetical protein